MQAINHHYKKTGAIPAFPLGQPQKAQEQAKKGYPYAFFPDALNYRAVTIGIGSPDLS